LEIGTVAIGRWVFEAGIVFLSENMFLPKPSQYSSKLFREGRGHFAGGKLLAPKHLS
jgi:hypothetical protein